MVKPKASARSSWLEEKWKPIFDVFEVSTLRRGRTLEKQGQVTKLEVKDGIITAEIQGSKFRSQSYLCTVSFPCTDWKESSFDEIALKLYERPDFLAALFASEWQNEFWNSLTLSGIRWFPDEELADGWRSRVVCSCNEPYLPCTHAAAAVYTLLRQVEDTPLQMLRYVGVDDTLLMNAVHQIGVVKGSERGKDNGSLLEIEESDEKLSQNPFNHIASDSLSAWIEEVSVWSANREKTDISGERFRNRIQPQWDKTKLRKFEEHALIRAASREE